MFVSLYFNLYLYGKYLFLFICVSVGVHIYALDTYLCECVCTCTCEYMYVSYILFCLYAYIVKYICLLLFIKATAYTIPLSRAVACWKVFEAFRSLEASSLFLMIASILFISTECICTQKMSIAIAADCFRSSLIFPLVFFFRPLCLSICLLFVRLSVYLSVCLSVCLSLVLSTRLSVSLSFFRSVYPSICLSVYFVLSIHLCVCLSALPLPLLPPLTWAVLQRRCLQKKKHPQHPETLLETLL